MKKIKNITLLIGIVCILVVTVRLVVKNILNAIGFKNPIIWNILPFVIMLLLLIIPTILLVRNLKNKTGKLLPIISIIINCIVILWVLFITFTPAIPKYLIYSELAIIDTYFVLIIDFLKNGGLLFIIGYTALIVGSFMSFPKKGK